ncbi:type I-E CRISPR-associated protein Cse2/CasB [Tessaracoccus sp. OH4464_COT-324]|uniref:type I-E CRISPR-associated protein Cse2/CasB n=1 Tax=Tessaracoccus sp. OH4464_COT-324 TaxID=2491059 RepID=UPI000F63094D|nr:type I-E CRISPR-associated protein Cse2/CasB [Tessaracoccus sp. OH4464_COT-324]RRD45913.1 type I-E CRISPR-associated protein Cse2/CasB [Tessaracoccus sp. OH4464_COT-324]
MSNDFSIKRFVNSKIRGLGGSDPSNISPTNRALLAQLRQSISAEPGTVPAVWSATLEGLPDFEGESYRLRVERAVHMVLTQFAMHQQSRSEAMHKEGIPFGQAVRQLAYRMDKERMMETPIYKRFTAMCLSTSIPGLAAHARGIISQLRSEKIPFDYAQFAQDLLDFQQANKTRAVIRRWGRDFSRVTKSDNENITEGDSE